MWFPEVHQIIPIKNKNYLQSLWIGICMPIVWLPKAVFICVIYPTLRDFLGGLWILFRTYSLLPLMGVTGYATGVDREMPKTIVREMSLDELREMIKKMDDQEEK